MTPLERRGTGRYPTSLGLSRDACIANLAVIARSGSDWSFATPNAYTRDRIVKLTAELDKLKETPAAFGKEGAALSFRLRSLDEGLRPSASLDARPIRWKRYFFDVGYRHFVSGEGATDFGGLSARLAPPPPTAGAAARRWLIDYRFGFFDTDAMTACVRGVLSIPVVVGPAAR